MRVSDGICSAPSFMQVAAEVIGAVGEQSAQWLDDGSEHPHRIALSVEASRVPDVTHRLSHGCASKNVKVPLRPVISFKEPLRGLDHEPSKLQNAPHLQSASWSHGRQAQR